MRSKGNRLRSVHLLAVALASAWLAGCVKEESCPTRGAVTYAGEVKPLLDAGCVRCHATTLRGAARNGAPSGIDFDSRVTAARHAAWAIQRVLEGTLRGRHHDMTICDQRVLKGWVDALERGRAVDAAAVDVDALPGDVGRPSSDGVPDGPFRDARAAPDACLTCGSGRCVDLTSDPRHCGRCSTACGAGAGCRAGVCTCNGALRLCAGVCTDVSANATHCGRCANTCAKGATCRSGACACPTGAKVCGGACVDTSSDGANCGACGKTCSGGQVCNAGTCTTTCAPLTACGSSCVDTRTSVAHCGRCGVACPVGAACSGGTCQCPAGTSPCGAACINTRSDPANCGGCGRVCGGGRSCTAGSCVCPAGLTACGSACTDTTKDRNNCGGCGKACAGGASCVSGACRCGGATVSFARDVQPIFAASCTSSGCHAGTRPKADLDLTATKAYRELVSVVAKQCSDGRKLVEPSDGGKSYLMDKLKGVRICAGTQMPKAGALPAAQLTTISNWICNGAPNN